MVCEHGIREERGEGWIDERREEAGDVKEGGGGGGVHFSLHEQYGCCPWTPPISETHG